MVHLVHLKFGDPTGHSAARRLRCACEPAPCKSAFSQPATIAAMFHAHTFTLNCAIALAADGGTRANTSTTTTIKG